MTTQNLPVTASVNSTAAQMTTLHLRVGWWSLLVFLSLGTVLELLHGFKAGWYLDVSNETRRLMFTLAHAHGTLLSLVHIAFAATIRLTANGSPGKRRIASRALCVSGVLIPAGFFLGGIQFYAGDPGIGILLLPAGAFLLFVSVFLIAMDQTRNHQSEQV
ncbi:MAG: hypothetical protein RIK87_29105 [Fuerstiella sp.]